MTQPNERMQRMREMQAATQVWYVSQLGLQNGSATLGLPGNNSTPIKRLFTKIDPNFQQILIASNKLIAIVGNEPDVSNDTISPSVTGILTNEPGFLSGMSAIVSQYQVEAQDRVTSLQYIEVLLLAGMLIALVLEGLFLFRPAILRINRAIQTMIEAEVQTAHSKVLEQKNKELAQKNAELDLALHEALVVTQNKQPRARVLRLGHYQVQGVQGNYYNVSWEEKNGLQMLVCECAVYKRNAICSHSLAAAALHSALAPYYKVDPLMKDAPHQYKSGGVYTS
jgi:hypothetical protein